MNFKIFFYLGAWRSLANREFVARNITDLEMLGFCGFRVETVIRKKRNTHRIKNSFFV